ncbi:hypothetical protein [Amycolatopsis sp. lyj-23]|uniref:hypothetical protein n=1 Tax=Amycolatopsis sp. lyj-23 TaxID=2789283 RepID=UPI003978EDFC
MSEAAGPETTSRTSRSSGATRPCPVIFFVPPVYTTPGRMIPIAQIDELVGQVRTAGLLEITDDDVDLLSIVDKAAAHGLSGMREPDLRHRDPS